MELFCNSNQEAYELGIVIGYLCSENSCHIVPKIVSGASYVSVQTFIVLLGETIDNLPICSINNNYHALKIVDPLLPRAQGYNIIDFSLQDAYRLGILAGLRIVAAIT
ncbi:MAG: hypothetical protein COC15_02055 [Legionellales bacterium]|nr:MAG: hypothetical protein COC15_02055 [Legionellales bacterium]